MSSSIAKEEESPNSSLSLLRSVVPNDHVNRAIVRACERLEAAMEDVKKPYREKVEVLMSCLENLLADCLTRVSPETTTLLFAFLLKHTLLLVLHGDWGESKAVKLHMISLFRRFRVRAEKKKLVRIVAEIDHLCHLMDDDPWGNSALVKILGDEKECEDELLAFVKTELGVFLNTRLEILIHARCELQAMILARKCLYCVATDSEDFKLFTREVIRLRDLYLLILNKAKSSEYIRSRILMVVNEMGSEGCVSFVKRCLSGELPFETLRIKSAEVVLNMALASAMTKNDTEDEILREMMGMWFEVLRGDRFDLLRLLVSKAVCSRYIYCICGNLIERVKLEKKELCVELFVRAITLNLNEIEMCPTGEDPTKVKQLKVQLSNGFEQLAEYLKHSYSLYREFSLAAFSVNPSQESFERIKGLEDSGMISKIKVKDGENDESLSKEEGKLLPWNLRVNQNAECDNNFGKISSTETDSPPPLSPIVTHVNPIETEESSCFCENPPHLSPERLPMFSIDRPRAKTHVNSLENTTDCSLTHGVLNLSLKEPESDHNKENNPGKPRGFGADQKTPRCLQVYNADSIGVSQTLCDDLSTLVYSVKHWDLTCDLEWAEIVRRCERYLSQGECFGVKKINRWPTKGERKGFSNEGERSDARVETVQIPTKKSKRKRKISKFYE